MDAIRFEWDNNKNNMRNETYNSKETTSFLIERGLDANNSMPMYTLPYQHFNKTGEKDVRR